MLTKQLIRELRKTYNPLIEKNIFKAAMNVQLGKIMGYFDDDGEHSFLDDYEEKKKKQSEVIEAEGIEDEAIAKAIKEHREFIVEASFEFDK